MGTLVGVSATVAIAWINQKTLNHRELIRDEIRMRQTLHITEQYFSNKRSVREQRQLAHSGEADALKAFGPAT